MLINLHKNATTTPAMRFAIQLAQSILAELPQHCGVVKFTIRRWRKRTRVAGGNHTAHRLQITLIAHQKEIVAYLRTYLRLSLDDLLAVVREFIEPDMGRSALDPLLGRHGFDRHREFEFEKTQIMSFRALGPGYVDMDVKYLPQMGDETERPPVFGAIERPTRWVFIAVKSQKTAAAARTFLHALQNAAPFKIQALLTDNGREFNDRIPGLREKDPSGAPEFVARCQALGIEHRLSNSKHPQTKGVAEQCNGRLAQVLKSDRFNSAHDVETTLHHFVWSRYAHLSKRAQDLKHPSRR